MGNYRWGIIAPGKIANKFVEGLAVIPGAVLYAAGSRDTGRAKEFAEKYGFQKAYGSYEELANDPMIDIVYIAARNPQHAEAAILCMRKGKAVICEKPIAVNAAQTNRMIQCAKENNVFLMEAMWTRFLPAVCRARELIKDGVIGNVRLVCADFGFRTDLNPESRLMSPAHAGGSLLDVGVYNLSFACMIFGTEPDRVQSGMKIGSTGVDEETSVLLSYKDGKSAMLFSAIRLATAQEAKIIGENGRIELPDYWHGKTLRLFSSGGMREFDLPFDASGYQFEAMEVMRCLDEGFKESPVMPLNESLSVMKTADLIRNQHNLRYSFDEE